MLKKNILASNVCYSCISHEDAILNEYFEKLEKIFSTISKCEKGAERISDLLEVPVCASGFKRLN